MATLARPGVEVSQNVQAQAATVVAPALVPCIVGPCFQLVEPVTSAGALDTSTVVSTAARLVSSTTIADPIPGISGTSMTLLVNGVEKAITFPTSVGGAAISQSVIAQTINNALGSSGSAKFVGGILEILTAAKGSSATLELKSSPATAHAPLSIAAEAGIQHTGRGTYDNRTYAVPYTSLPSPLVSDPDDLVVKGEDVNLYRYFNNTLTAFSKTSAPNWNSYAGGTTKVHNTSRDITFQPAFSNQRTSLHGIKSTGAKTNKLMHLGREATITIPLAHNTGGGAVVWPDPTGAGYLKVTALGYQNYKVSPTNPVGDYVGSAGNAISVAFTHGGTHTAVWNPGTKTLTIDKDHTTTYAQLQAALATVTNASTALVIELGIPSGLSASPCLGATTTPWGGNTRTYYLAGGSDPVNFSADAAGDARKAWITGAVHADLTATQLGIAGETLDISVDGGEWVTATFIAGNKPHTDIISALGSLGTAALTAADSEEGTMGTALKVLQVSTTSTAGHDSTLEIKADNPVVIQKLFSGTSTSTDSVAAVKHTNSWGGAGVDTRKVVLTSGVGGKYNTSAVGHHERAVVPGGLTIEVADVGIAGHMVFDFGDGDVGGVFDGVKTFDLVHDPAGAADTDTITLPNQASVTALATSINAALVNTAGKIGVGVIGGRLVLSDATGTSSFKINNAHADIQALLNTGGNSFHNVVVSSATSYLNIKDTGTGNALQVTSVGNAVANALHGAAFAATFDPTDAADLTALFLATNAGFTYSDGSSPAVAAAEGCVVFAGGIDGAESAKDPLTAVILPGTYVNITYTRMWPCSTAATSPSYTGRVFHGRSNKVYVGDKLWNNGSVVGVVNAIGDLAIGGSFTGALLTISEFAVSNSTDLDKWYITAENLPSTDTARPAPELATSDTAAAATAKHALLRNSAGIALPGSATVYAQYSALRKDVTAASADPQLLTFNSASEVTAALGSAVPANPLSLALVKAFEATSTISISALGVSETTDDAPFGTVDAYAEALDFLERKEVFALAPLTQDPSVHKIVAAHVTTMSLPQNKKERVAFLNAALPTEKVPTTAMSGTATIASIGGDKYELTFSGDGINAITALDGLLDANGSALSVTAGTTLTPEQGVYVDRAGDALRYLVTKVVSASVLQIETAAIFSPDSGPGTGGNGDAYYATEAASPGSLSDFSAAGESCSVFVRQAAISKATVAGRDLIVSTMADITGGASGYQNKLCVWLQPESFNISLGGVTTKVPGFYHCAALAALTGELSPSQPYTNLPIPGFMAPVGSSDLFSESQMATAAAGGVWWAIQDSPGGAVFSRHQLTTDTSSLVTREFSITVALQYVAKLVRAQAQRFSGRNNITKSLLTSISIAVSGALSSVVGPIVGSASLDRIYQSTESPDKIALEVSVTPLYPANTITITIYV